VAVNLLLPFARRAHFEVASEADVLVTFWGGPRRRTSNTWIHQCGSVEEALAAQAAGADAGIAQGVESGGHVRWSLPALELLERAVHRATPPMLSRVPIRLQSRLAAAQVPGRPLFGRTAATAGRPPNLVKAGPLYAGGSVARIHDIRPAGELVRELASDL